MRATVIRHLEARRLGKIREEGSPLERTSSRATSLHGSLYSNRTSFLRRTMRKVGFGGKVAMKPDELKRFSSIQAAHTGQVLKRHPSRATINKQTAAATAGPSTVA